MKRIVVSLLDAMGYQLVRVRGGRPKNGTMEGALDSLARRLQINTIIDVGASSGIWSRRTMDFFPASTYLLIEANPAYEAELNDFVLLNDNVQFVVAAAGTTQGGRVNFSFDPADPYGGQASNMPHVNSTSIPEVSLDNEVATRGLEGPYLIKLDTHGFEVPILQGATQTLVNTQAIIIECYNFKISPECLLFHEMCVYLDQLGFRCVDIVDPLWRPYDQAFWQMDMVFVRKERPEFSYPGYR